MNLTCRPALPIRWRWVLAPVVAGLLAAGCSSENPTAPRATLNAEFRAQIEEGLGALVQELHWQIEAPQRLPARIAAGEFTPFDGSYTLRTIYRNASQSEWETREPPLNPTRIVGHREFRSEQVVLHGETAPPATVAEAIRIDHTRRRQFESRYSVNGGTDQVTRVIENSSNGSLMLDSSQPSALRLFGSWRISGLESHSRSARGVRLTANYRGELEIGSNGASGWNGEITGQIGILDDTSRGGVLEVYLLTLTVAQNSPRIEGVITDAATRQVLATYSWPITWRQ